MAQASKELGVMAVLAKRMVEERLPKALALKERVDRVHSLVAEIVSGERRPLPGMLDRILEIDLEQQASGCPDDHLVDRGETLNGLDLNFLEQVVTDANAVIPMMKDDPRVAQISARMLQLYKEITTKALENEQAKKD